jgi:hypothetical protein
MPAAGLMFIGEPLLAYACGSMAPSEGVISLFLSFARSKACVI